MFNNWTKKQIELHEKVLASIKAQIDMPGDTDRARYQFCIDELKKFGEIGLTGLCVPERYGGLGLDIVTSALMQEAVGEGCKDIGVAFSAAAHLYAAVMPLFEYGSDNLKKHYLHRACAAELICANAITEPNAGSDILQMETKATKKNDGYLLNGTKTYVTNAPVADLFVVYAVTNPNYGYMGISGFIVERDTEGLVIDEPFKKIGLETSQISTVNFCDCYIPSSNLIGKEGKGFAIFSRSMQLERSCIFAIYLGIMRRQLNNVIEHAKNRVQFGKSIAKNQAVSHRIVDMKLRLESASMLLYKACEKIDNKENASMDVSIAKVAVSEAAVKSSLDAIQIYGGKGCLVEEGVEQFLRDAVPSTIFSGTTEIQKDLIAKEIGL
jgi:alkylation response protein AidB-like acyl-CoA dehydrogenase